MTLYCAEIGWFADNTPDEYPENYSWHGSRAAAAAFAKASVTLMESGPAQYTPAGLKRPALACVWKVPLPDLPPKKLLLVMLSCGCVPGSFEGGEVVDVFGDDGKRLQLEDVDGD
jgi:hypothetical protein